MEISVTLIRSGLTQSGEEGRYIGVTDEPLCEQGKRILQQKKGTGCYPAAGRVFAAGSLRCRETAILLFPRQPVIVENGFEPYDYGDFEGKTYTEMEADLRFADWAFGKEDKLPNSADPHVQRYRSVEAFRRIMSECVDCAATKVAIITHKSAILAILRGCCVPRLAHGKITLENGGGATILYNIYRKSASIQNFF